MGRQEPEDVGVGWLHVAHDPGLRADVGDLDRFGDQAEREERVGDLLLLGDDGVGDRLDAVGLPLQRDLDDRHRKADRRRELLGDRVDVALGPVVDLARAAPARDRRSSDRSRRNFFDEK